MLFLCLQKDQTAFIQGTFTENPLTCNTSEMGTDQSFNNIKYQQEMGQVIKPHKKTALATQRYTVPFVHGFYLSSCNHQRPQKRITAVQNIWPHKMCIICGKIIITKL